MEPKAQNWANRLLIETWGNSWGDMLEKSAQLHAEQKLWEMCPKPYVFPGDA